MLSLDEALALVRAYWDSPRVSPLLEAARYGVLMTAIRHDLPADQWHNLFVLLGGKRLDVQKRGKGIATRENVPVWTLLAEQIDRRERLGIPAPQPDKDERARRASIPSRNRRAA